MPPPAWKACAYCGQQMGAASLKQHEPRCRARPEIAAEMALRAEENFDRPAPLPDWEHCPNCGEQYSPTSMAMHVKRCKRLRPKGKNTAAAATAASERTSPTSRLRLCAPSPKP